MPSAQVFEASIMEDNSAVVTALLLRSPANTAFTQSSFTSITWKLFNADTAAKISSGSLTVTDVVFNTLQSWPDKPSESGYNFSATFAGGLFSSDAHQYRLEITFNQTGGGSFVGVCNMSPIQLFGS